MLELVYFWYSLHADLIGFTLQQIRLIEMSLSVLKQSTEFIFTTFYERMAPIEFVRGLVLLYVLVHSWFRVRSSPC